MTKQEEIIRTPEQKEAHNSYRRSLKREEIRDGIKRIEIEWYGEPPDGTIATQHRTFVAHLLDYLHSQGVVIKGTVEATGDDEKGYQVSCYSIEPLIEAKVKV